MWRSCSGEGNLKSLRWLLQIKAVAAARSLQFQCTVAVSFCGNAVFEMSVSYKLFQFLVALYPPWGESSALCSEFKACFGKLLVKDVFCSLYLFPILSCFCVLAGVDRHCLGFGVKNLLLWCMPKTSAQHIHFASGLLSAGFLGTGKKVADVVWWGAGASPRIWHPG